MVATHEPIEPRVRLAISLWPDDPPRGAVSTFCAEHDISRKSFYELLNRANTDGPDAVETPGSPGGSERCWAASYRFDARSAPTRRAPTPLRAPQG
jgi:hypothetical protein